MREDNRKKVYTATISQPGRAVVFLKNITTIMVDVNYYELHTDVGREFFVPIQYTFISQDVEEEPRKLELNFTSVPTYCEDCKQTLGPHFCRIP